VNEADSRNALRTEPSIARAITNIGMNTQAPNNRRPDALNPMTASQ
jgi:hypothetical protein